jgi:hypothetical protein
VEIVANVGTYVSRSPAAQFSGLRGGSFGRWADGVTSMRADCVTFAEHWQAHNEWVLSQPAGSGPLWAVRDVARSRGLPVARISAHFGPPWDGKLACDNFHPSQQGYRDWTRAILRVI